MAWLEEAIGSEAEKLITRHEEYAQNVHDENGRRSRRSTIARNTLSVLKPDYWSVWNGFDPYHVRSRRGTIAHSIGRSLRRREYRPQSPISYSVPKSGGGSRTVCVFPVADNAVSLAYFKELAHKNSSRLSGRSYAYQDGVTAHDAVEWVYYNFKRADRLFIAEYDFSKFFDTISHDYLWHVLDDHEFVLSNIDRHVIGAFLTAPEPADAAAYSPTSGPARSEGVPQGTSLSLFLANVAAYELDRQLEGIGVNFARYADDTVVWSHSYEEVIRAVECIRAASESIGSEINFAKSDGVRILHRRGAKTEFSGTNHIEFLGHRIGIDALSFKSTTLARLRERIAELAYFNLLFELEQGTQKLDRIAGKSDLDYYVFVLQLRRLIYGDLSERELSRYSGGFIPRLKFKGFMSFFPLVDDVDTLLDLDKYIVSTAFGAMRKRARLLRAAGMPVPAPHDMPAETLVHFKHFGGGLDFRLPSIRRAATVVNQAARQYGTTAIGATRLYEAY